MIKQKQLKLYNPTLLGTVANVSVRDISYSLVDLFPEFFRQLYNNMRLANIKILSNTYVNMMVFSTIIVSLVSLVVLPTIFFLQGSTLLMALLKALLMAIIAGAITFLAFYTYPIMKIKERRRSIKTNLPFALNHMAAVASSGVPPNVLFKLIASSKEYGEICIESEKINQFVTIFGYDLLSAMKTVAETTPSKDFKDFLDGMISTIETGGNLQEFLGEKSKEELLNYELDRQKYTETIATYSDIYTGLLIAAPLFFVAALSLISILGGGIGGVSVDVIISVGTYIALPVLNILFLVFLEITQPEF
jgi:flagellar protein FlaJ